MNNQVVYQYVGWKLLNHFLLTLLSSSLVAGGAVSKVDPNSTGLNPAWRTAAAHILTQETWPEGTSGNGIHIIEKKLKGYLETLEELVGPNGGAYFNKVCLL